MQAVGRQELQEGAEVRREIRSKSESDNDRQRAYVVIALTASAGKKCEDCKVIPRGDVYPAIYSQLYGPASRRDCEKWRNANSGKSGPATE